MIRRSPVTAALALGLLAVLVIGGGGLWYLFLRDAGPAAVGGRQPRWHVDHRPVDRFVLGLF